MKRRLMFLGLILSSALVFTGCSNETPEPIENNKKVETIMYYKTIPVKITEIRKTWSSNKENTWLITVKSDEYKLQKSFNQTTTFMGSDAYADDLYRGKLKIGDVIKAEMNTWKQGEKVIQRDLSHLKK